MRCDPMLGLAAKKTIKLTTAILVLAAAAYAYATGPNQGYTGAPGDFGDCTACHDTFGVANVGPGSVTINQAPSVYEPGQSYTMLVALQDPQARRWGFELTGIDGQGNRAGTFAPLGSDTQIASTGPPVLDRQYIEHTLLGTFPGTTGGHTWQVQWTAPASDAGAVHFYVAGNAANDDGTDQGDYIYTNAATSESPSTVVTLQLLSNPQGLTLDVGTTYSISWSATNATNVGSYEVRYSTDDGATFPITNLIFSTTDPSDTTVQWVVPDTPTGAAKIRVLASTSSGSVVTVISGAFTILGSGTSPLPVIDSAHNVGNKLVVVGENFQEGAVVAVNAAPQTTINKPDFSHKLICKKGLKGVAAGTAITLTVTNPGGVVSSPFLFTRLSN
jgi:hypothetical protein